MLKVILPSSCSLSSGVERATPVNSDSSSGRAFKSLRGLEAISFWGGDSFFLPPAFAWFAPRAPSSACVRARRTIRSWRLMATYAPPDKGGLLTNVAAGNGRTHGTHGCGRSILPPLHTAEKNIYLTLHVHCTAVDACPPARPLSFIPREVPKVLCLPLRQRVSITRSSDRREGEGGCREEEGIFRMSEKQAPTGPTITCSEVFQRTSSEGGALCCPEGRVSDHRPRASSLCQAGPKGLLADIAACPATP